MITVKKELVFDPDRNLAFDLYLPEHENGKILVFWHGGGWFRGDKSSAQPIGEIAANNGFKVLIPNYRLAPRHTFPSAHEDSARLIKWLLQSDYYAAEDQIVQIGASVGGTMALVLSMKYGFKTVTWSAPLNFSRWLHEHEDVHAAVDAKNELGLEDPTDIHASFYKYFVETYLGPEATDIERNQLNVEATYNGKIGPILLYNSTNELVPLQDTLNFVSLLAHDDLPVTLQTVAGSGHAMDYSENVLSASLQFLAD